MVAYLLIFTVIIFLFRPQHFGSVFFSYYSFGFFFVLFQLFAKHNFRLDSLCETNKKRICATCSHSRKHTVWHKLTNRWNEKNNTNLFSSVWLVFHNNTLEWEKLNIYWISIEHTYTAYFVWRMIVRNERIDGIVMLQYEITFLLSVYLSTLSNQHSTVKW